MEVHSWPLNSLSTWNAMRGARLADGCVNVRAMVGDAALKRACIELLARDAGATAASISLIASEALSNRIISELADVILESVPEAAGEHARATHVEAAVAAVAARGARGLRAVDELAAFLVAVARRGCIAPKSRLIEMRGSVATIPDARGWRAIVKLPGGPVCSAVQRNRKWAERAACTEALERAGLATTEQWIARITQ